MIFIIVFPLLYNAFSTNIKTIIILISIQAKAIMLLSSNYKSGIDIFI